MRLNRSQQLLLDGVACRVRKYKRRSSLTRAQCTCKDALADMRMPYLAAGRGGAGWRLLCAGQDAGEKTQL